MSTVPKLTRKLTLEDLANGIPVIPEDAVGFYKHNCMICFDSQGHKSGVKLEVYHKDTYEVIEVYWEGDVDVELQRAYRDERKATDFGACAIALLLVRELTEFTAIEQSNVGTTIDYFLIQKEQLDDTLIFNNSAYLEVSGIRYETPENTIEARIKEKVKRLRKQEALPAYIVVTEFSKPRSNMVEV